MLALQKIRYNSEDSSLQKLLQLKRALRKTNALYDLIIVKNSYILRYSANTKMNAIPECWINANIDSNYIAVEQTHTTIVLFIINKNECLNLKSILLCASDESLVYFFNEFDLLDLPIYCNNCTENTISKIENIFKKPTAVNIKINSHFLKQKPSYWIWVLGFLSIILLIIYLINHKSQQPIIAIDPYFAYKESFQNVTSPTIIKSVIKLIYLGELSPVGWTASSINLTGQMLHLNINRAQSAPFKIIEHYLNKFPSQFKTEYGVNGAKIALINNSPMHTWSQVKVKINDVTSSILDFFLTRKWILKQEVNTAFGENQTGLKVVWVLEKQSIKPHELLPTVNFLLNYPIVIKGLYYNFNNANLELTLEIRGY